MLCPLVRRRGHRGRISIPKQTIQQRLHSRTVLLRRQISSQPLVHGGWTLQGLLAPGEIIFFDKDWNRLGTLNFLMENVIEATGIEGMVLRKSSLRRPSIATRMSWALKRLTSREEDMAYCLLGLFDVSMPLLYGEGGVGAFLRLQKEIANQTTDETLFAWTANIT